MSVRTRDALEAAGDFSLRHIVSESTPPNRTVAGQGSTQSGLKFSLDGLAVKSPPAHAPPHPVTPAPVHLPSPATSGSQSVGGLMRFVLPANQLATPSSVPPAPTLTALNPSTFGSQTTRVAPAQVAPPSNRRGWSLRSEPAAPNESATNQQDVMRLTAYVDELTQRLKKTQSKLETTELQLARTSQALCSERQATQAKIGAIKKDLAEAHELEGKLRSELASRPSKTDTKKSDFMASVETVLQADYQMQEKKRQVAEMETRVAALGEMKVALEKEMIALTAAKEAAEAESGDLHESNVDGSQRLAAIEYELEEHNARIIEARTRTEEAEAAAEQAVAAALKMETEARAREKAANTAIRMANDAETDAIRREAARQEFEKTMQSVSSGVPNPNCPFVIDDSDNVPSQVDAPTLIPDLISLDAPGPRTNAKIKATIPDVVTAYVPEAPCHNNPPTRRCGTVSGDTPPAQELSGHGRSSRFANQSPTTVMTAIAAYDTPVSFGMTKMHTEELGGADVVVVQKEKDDPTAAMVNAVVTDLKQKFQENVAAKNRGSVRIVAPLV